jgi:hypothetical protein
LTVVLAAPTSVAIRALGSVAAELDSTVQETDMASSTIPSPTRTRIVRRKSDPLRHRRHRQPDWDSRARSPESRDARPALARYVDWRGDRREVIADVGAGGSVLVVDRHADTLADRRLVAHLAPDEPAGNARLVSCCYVEQASGGRYSCRPLTDEDLHAVPFAEDRRGDRSDRSTLDSARSVCPIQTDQLGRAYRLEPLSTGMSIPELRWCRGNASAPSRDWHPLSLREAVGALERYEPLCSATHDVVSRGRADDSLSTAVLRAELARVRESPIVLNRGLREVVLAVIGREGLSLSEIAMRCGRVKRDAAGNLSGETSWLARRLGMMPEGGRDRPTPWVHSDVLALIARDGLGLSPREVEST